jgi:hypothetical protein
MKNDPTQTYDQAQSVEASTPGGPDAGTTHVISSLSADFLAKLRAVEGEGLSRDPKNNPRKTIKLLQDKDAGSKYCPPGARAGQYQVGDTLCDNFIFTPILFLDSYIEWKINGGGGPETHYVLPADATWDQEARCWFRDNGNSVQEAAEIIGLVNGEVYSQSFRWGGLKVARQLNTAAGALVIETDQGPVQLPFYGANWRMGAIEKPGSNGKSVGRPWEAEGISRSTWYRRRKSSGSL